MDRTLQDHRLSSHSYLFSILNTGSLYIIRDKWKELYRLQGCFSENSLIFDNNYQLLCSSQFSLCWSFCYSCSSGIFPGKIKVAIWHEHAFGSQLRYFQVVCEIVKSEEMLLALGKFMRPKEIRLIKS